MTQHNLVVLLNLLFIFGALFTIYGVYFCIIAAFGLRKQSKRPTSSPSTKFAIVIAARNEETVIGELLDSLQAQNYPQEMFDIYVAPNNCTDATEAVSRAHGAQIFLPKGVIRAKGEVLSQITDALLASPKQYDALCVFDADNVVHQDFLQKMNDAHQRGIAVAQGHRDGKNPKDSAMATCYALYYWVVNLFYNRGREAIGLSSLIIGSGYMVSMDLLRRIGGWHTSTITEDYEFTAQCVLAGEKVHYISDAVTYDELPTTFVESWKQRRRWSTGFVQSMEIHLGSLFHYAVDKRSFVAFDVVLAYIAPITQFISIVVGLASLLLSGYGILKLHLMPLTQVVLLLTLALGVMFILCALFALLFIYWEKKQSTKGLGKGVAMFVLFLITFVPIGIISLFNKKKSWEAITHSRSIAFSDIGGEK